MGLLVLLVLVPVTLWLVGELLARFSRAPAVWSLFGFSLVRHRSERGGAEPASRRPIRRVPDRPPRLTFHDRRPPRIVLDPADRDEPGNGRLKA